MSLTEVRTTAGGYRRNGAVAVIGASCRLPGAPDPDALWRLLFEGRHALDRPGPKRSRYLPASATGVGGWLDDVAGFDAPFFAMSPREAAAADPQQRLLLELAWEALEDARIVSTDLCGSRTGIWVGAMTDDYALLSASSGAPTAHSLTGLQRTLLANRVSYLLGARGPSLTVDCGQASSLVSVHLACQSLLHGESELALAAGVQLNLAAETAERVRALGVLSPDARCFTFDARANGYVRGEGGAVLVLKPLERALTDGDAVRAVILGTATNNDGGGPGLSTPDPDAQRDVVRRAWEAAGVDPTQAAYVELHGTGTPVGDAAEATALGAVFGPGRSAGDPLLVGSVKTNIGHLEGGAGIAGLLKTVLSLEHDVVPPSLNFDVAAPAVEAAAGRLRVPRTRVSWGRRTKMAGVSSFGVGGSNCHVVVAAADALPAAVHETLPMAGRDAPGPAGTTGPWLLHGRDRTALAEQAARLAAHVRARPHLASADVGFSLARTRSVFEHRAAVLSRDRDGFLAGLEALADGRPAAGLLTGAAPRPRPAAFVFPGQGTQWPGMARRLLSEQPAFAAAVADCARELDPLTGWSLSAVLEDRPGAPSVERVDVVQPVLFAMMVALAALWREYGVEPIAVVGHSQGEVAAAYVAGALSLADAARIVAVRSQLVGRHLSGTGGMASVLLGEDALADRLRPWTGRLTRAATNSPEATVFAGPGPLLDEAVTALARDGVQVKRIAVDYPSHSPAVEVLRGQLAKELAGIRPRRGRVPFYSSLTGGLFDTEGLDASYWYRNLRHEVRFSDAVGALASAGTRVFVEVGPHPVLLPAVHATASTAGLRVDLVETIARGEGDSSRFHAALAAAHVAGTEVRWEKVWSGTGARTVALPTYAFTRRPHWLPGREATSANDRGTGPGQGTATEPGEHPAAARPAGHQSVTAEFVAALAAAVLGHPDGETVDTGRPLRELGLDSLLSLRLAERLSAACGLRVRPRTLFDHPTCAELAEHLATRSGAGDSTSGERAVPARADLGGRCPTPAGMSPGPAGSLAAAPDRAAGERAQDGAHAGAPDTAEDATGAATVVDPSTRRDDHVAATDSRATPTDDLRTAPSGTTGGAWRRDEQEPIAVIGLACRFPGADGPATFWRMLVDGRDPVLPLPAGRWPRTGDDGPPLPARAGLLEDENIESFDAQFFGIAPDEAREMDPQQRLMLEVAWEAIEDAGLAGQELRGSRTGVYVGVTWHDWADRAPAARVSPYTATGRALNMTANRISYALGLRGPSMAVDTACSSSLLAVHLACQALRSGEATTAIAGGVSLLLTEDSFRSLRAFGGLSADGRCKTFDASADGYGRGEGCGAVVLKTLSAARADGDDIWCIIRGSATNNDGPSNGLTSPNPAAQEEVLRDACRRAGVVPSDIHFVETHGTGTALGDHIEAAALGTVLAEGRPQDRPLLLGAVKSQIGHLEAAAGIAGLIKTALILKHRAVPANLHCTVPNPHIDFSGLRLPQALEPWPDRTPALAGVSSFGWGGSNVHMILEGVVADPAVRRPSPRAEAGPALVLGPLGSGWADMARRLWQTRHVFRETWQECARTFARHAGQPTLPSPAEIDVPGPAAAFAFHLATVALLREVDTEPASYLGIGVGEISACVAAGLLDLADAVPLLDPGPAPDLDPAEAMAVVESAADDLPLPPPATVRVAARLGTRTTLLAGPPDALRALVCALAAAGTRCALLARTDGTDLCPSRTDDIGARTTTLRPGPVPVLSAHDGSDLARASTGAHLSMQEARAPVCLDDTVSEMLAGGCRVLLDCGGHPVVTAALRQTADDDGRGVLVLPAVDWADGNRAALLRPFTTARSVTPTDQPPALVTLSAKSGAALRELAGRTAAAIERDTGLAVREVAAATARRTAHAHRLALVTSSPEDLVRALRAHAAGEQAPGVVSAPQAAHRRPRTAFLFPDDCGPDAIPAVISELLGEPAFRAVAQECDRAVRTLLGRSLLDEPTEQAEPDLPGAGVGHRGGPSAAAVLTLQRGLAALLRSWGIRPDVVVGRGAGLVGALHEAGALSLAEAVRRAAGEVDPAESVPGAAEERTVPILDLSAPAGTPTYHRALSDADMNRLRQDGVDVVVELRARPVLHVLTEAGGNEPIAGVTGGTEARDAAVDREHLATLLARLFVLGVPVRMPSVAAPSWKPPAHPWQRTRFPLPGPAVTADVPAAAVSVQQPVEPAPLRPDSEPPRSPAPPSQATAKTPALPPVTETIRSTVAQLVGVPLEEIDDDQPLRELGMTSVMSVELCNRWQMVFGLRLPDSTVWNHPTVSALSALVTRRLGAAVEEGAGDRPAPPDSGSARDHGRGGGTDGTDGIAELEDELRRELAALAQRMEDAA
ncbi:beta-ketoacyl synthase N-terminal-like domain-containing protein [Streptomyces olivaceoviridis]|uniref:type I polyketide synthase n=1 Tax=Streptomyces olivaceoviridis TaxID=1921 RepID=UPI0033A14CEB